MMEKNKLLKEIDLNVANLNIDIAIKKAFKGYDKYKDNCFLNKILQIREKQGNIQESISISKKMLKLEPANITIIEKIASSYYKIKDYKNSLKYYKQLQEENPCSSKYNCCTGYIYHLLKDYKNAAKYYTFAIKIDSKNLSAINNLGIIYYQNNQWECALNLFNKAIVINPGHPEAYHHLGIINREILNDLELSILYLKKALRIDPKYPFNSYQLALSYKKAGEIEKAKEYLEKTLCLSPNFEEAKKELKGLAV